MKSQKSAPGKVAEQTEPSWEVVMEKKDFKVWRRPIPNSHLYEYRGQPRHTHTVLYDLYDCFLKTYYISYALLAVLGSYDDVTPRQFFNVQVPFSNILTCN